VTLPAKNADDYRGWRRVALGVVGVIDKISLLGAAVAGAASLVMVVAITTAVARRYFFRNPILGIEEFSGYLLAIIVFAGLGWCMQRESFIRMDAGYGRLRGRAKFVADILIYCLGILYAAILTNQMWDRVQRSHESGQVSIGPLQVSMWIPQMSVAIGLSIFLLQLGANLVRLLATGRATKGEPEPLESLETLQQYGPDSMKNLTIGKDAS
jgi:TRAP-type transport system small permease protein